MPRLAAVRDWRRRILVKSFDSCKCTKRAWLLRRAYAPAILAGDAVDNPCAVRSTPAKLAGQLPYAVLVLR